jgi:ATP-dependent RNA helicase DeaD
VNAFYKLGLSEEVCEVLEGLGFQQPTEIQQKAIPQLIQNPDQDFIGLAQTGTGKTAAFGLPLIEQIEAFGPVQAIILAPTRELAQQSGSQLTHFTTNLKGIHVEVVYGGVDIQKQIKALKRAPQILVSTPGRLQDLLRRKAIKIEQLKHLVLDEADEMLNMGFKEEIDNILQFIPSDNRIWLFSATMPKEIRRIISQYMAQPLEIQVNANQKSNEDITHQYVITKSTNKVPAIQRFIELWPEMRAIMFCRTKRETQEIADQLSQNGYIVEALHGDLNQNQRNTVMRKFKQRSMQLLIATDVAARGIDVQDLSHVFHHRLPDQLEAYTHRSGRTGRAGKKGVSLVFINSRETRKIKSLEKALSIQFSLVDIPSKQDLKSGRLNHWANILLKTQVNKEVDHLIDQMDSELQDMSKQELLRRLFSQQLEQLMINEDLGNEEDLNVREGKQKTINSREKDHYQKPTNTNRFFINLGQIDGLTKADLLHFVADIAEIDRQYFGEIDIKKNCSFFELESSKANGLAHKFKHIVIDGHQIRVNPDDQGRPKRKTFDQAKPERKKRNKRRNRDKGRRRK